VDEEKALDFEAPNEQDGYKKQAKENLKSRHQHSIGVDIDVCEPELESYLSCVVHLLASQR
jgi:hypothetical protein